MENLKKLNFQTRENAIVETIIEETLPKLEKEVAPELTEFVYQLLTYKGEYGGSDEEEENQTILLSDGSVEERDIYGEYELVPQEQRESFMVNYFSMRINQRRERLNPRKLRQTRQDILRRVKDHGNHHTDITMNTQIECCIKKYKLREKARIDYGLQEA